MLATLLLREDATDGRDRGPKVVGIACGFLAASMVVGWLRLGLRCKRGLLSWDDACIVMSLAFSTLQTVAACMSESWGYGKPVKSLSTHELSRAIFWFYFAQIAYKGVIWPAKISILILYGRVFGDSTQQVTSFGIRLRTSLICLIVFGVTFFFVSEIVTIFTCVPIRRYWDKSVQGRCDVDPLIWWFVQSALNTVSDVFILCLPMPLIKDLQMPRRQKISLMLVFALGIFITVCTIVRMTTFKTGAQGNDTTYDGAITLMWSLIETNIAVMCACLPLLRPLIARLVPGFHNTKSRSKDKSSTYGLKNLYGYGSSRSRKSKAHNGGAQESWDWVDQTTIVATNMTNHKTTSDEIHIGTSNDPYGLDVSKHGGITKQTDVEVTTECASDHGSQRHLTASAARSAQSDPEFDAAHAARSRTPSI